MPRGQSRENPPQDPDGPGTSSSGASSCPDGFWRHGQWVDRPRTPSELRSHRGGGGPRRAHRRQERVQQYLRGEWRPKWLEDYITQRKQRDTQTGEKLGDETMPTQPSEVKSEAGPSQPTVEEEEEEVEEWPDPPAEDSQAEWTWHHTDHWASSSFFLGTLVDFFFVVFVLDLVEPWRVELG